MMNKRTNLGINAASAFFGKKETDQSDVSDVNAVSGGNDVVDVDNSKHNKKTSRFSLYLPPAEKEYLDTMNWYDRNGSLNAYLVNLVQADKQRRYEEYKEALNLINNKGK